MLEADLVDQAVTLLSTAIGMIMEDHVDEALHTGTVALEESLGELRVAGLDIATLAAAAEVLRRRSGDASSRS